MMPGYITGQVHVRLRRRQHVTADPTPHAYKSAADKTFMIFIGIRSVVVIDLESKIYRNNQ